MAITIAGTGHYVPDFVVSNDDFTRIVDTSDEWIRTRTGMQRRHFSFDEPTWQMGAKAAKQAIEAAGIDPAEIDMIICSTVTPDFAFPSTACMIQQQVGADNAFAFDVAVACAGITYTLDIAQRFLHTGGANTVLIVGAERLSQQTDFTDRSTCVLFGDGAGALIVKRGEGLYGSFLRSDASGTHHVYYKHPTHDIPFGKVADSPDEPFHALKTGLTYMDGKNVYKFATRAMPEAVLRACESAGVALEELDLIIPHQANLRIIETAAKNLGLPLEKIYVNIQEYANTSSATILIGLDECVRAGKIKRGDKLCLVGFGGGLTYGAVVFAY